MDESIEELSVQIQHRMIERLSESEKHYKDILNFLEECIFECDIEGKFIYVNKAWTDNLGYTYDELLGCYLFDLFNGKKRFDEIQEEYAYVRNQGKDLEIDLVNSKGNVVWFSLRIQAQESGYSGSLVNVTKKRFVEDSLQKEQEQSRKLSMVASSTTNIVIITDSEGSIEWVNSSFEKISGYTCDEVIGRKPGTFLQGPLTDKVVVKDMREAISEGRGFSVELVNYTKSRNPYWIYIEANPVFSESGDLVNFIAIETDITEKIRSDRIIREKDINYRLVVDNINEVIIRTDSKGHISFINHAWTSITGFDVDSCMSRSITDFVCADDGKLLIDKLIEFQTGDSDPLRYEMHWDTADQRGRWVEILLSPLEIDINGRVEVGMAARISDVEDRHQAATALQEAKDSAEAMAENRSRFLANVSHEIRTPLNAVMGMSELLTESELDEDQTEYVKLILSSSDALLSLLDDVMHYTKLESGNLQLEYLRFSLWDCFEDACNLFSDESRKKSLSLILNIESEVPHFVIGDESRLRQVLLNLLSNAVKFTESGSIQINVFCKFLSIKDIDLNVSITDTGVGIDNVARETLFDAFIQGDVSVTRKHGGAGLGLAICKQICEMSGGGIALESEQGNGSTFNFNLVLERCDNSSDEVQALANVSVKGEHVWLLGADSSLAAAVAKMAAREGLVVRKAKNVAEISAHVVPPLLIIATEESKNNVARSFIESTYPADGGPYLITFTSSYDSPKPILINRYERSINSPITPRIFKNVISTLNSSGGAKKIPAVITAKDASYNNGHGASILIVEDNVNNQFVLSEFLTRFGCGVTCVNNGAQACVEILKNSYHIIFMDLQMPIMDGLTATKTIREFRCISKQPVIVALTADAMHGDREKCISAGMSDYMSKPVTRLALIAVIDKYSNLWRDTTEYADTDNDYNTELELTACANINIILTSEAFSDIRFQDEGCRYCLENLLETVNTLNSQRFFQGDISGFSEEEIIRISSNILKYSNSKKVLFSSK